VLVDDIISTGRTMIAAIVQLCAQQSITSTSSP
jgi:phosphoribosylpyrophosphate synthetase